MQEIKTYWLLCYEYIFSPGQYFYIKTFDGNILFREKPLYRIKVTEKV